MQSSHTRTVDLCFLACKASSFWSIFQENSVKCVFLAIAMLLFLSVTPHGWLFVHRHIAIFVSHTPWLVVCSSPYCYFCQSRPIWLAVCSTWYAVTGCFGRVWNRKQSRRREICTPVHSLLILLIFFVLGVYPNFNRLVSVPGKCPPNANARRYRMPQKVLSTF